MEDSTSDAPKRPEPEKHHTKRSREERSLRDADDAASVGSTAAADGGPAATLSCAEKRRWRARWSPSEEWEHQTVSPLPRKSLMSRELCLHRQAAVREAEMASWPTERALSCARVDRAITGLNFWEEFRRQKRRSLKEAHLASMQTEGAILSSLLTNVQLWDDLEEAREKVHEEVRQQRHDCNTRIRGLLQTQHLTPCESRLGEAATDGRSAPMLHLRQIYVENGKRKVPRLPKKRKDSLLMADKTDVVLPQLESPSRQ